MIKKPRNTSPIPSSKIDMVALTKEDKEITQAIEILFFAYRDFIAEPDSILETQGFGRAHHRTLHFVGRNPNVSVTELLSILAVTKQSLGRVLRDLIEGGYVGQTICSTDRRKRLLTLTRKGNKLLSALLTPQHESFMSALRASDTKTFEAWKRFMVYLINPAHQAEIMDRIKK